jgi:hypothetical protein
MIKTTVWKPDTCDCEVRFQWDTEDPNLQTEPTLTYVGGQRCPLHSSIQDHLGRIRDENGRKNQVENQILQTFASVLGEEVDDGSGQLYLKWKGGITLNWHFEGEGDSRVLHVSVSGYSLNTQQKATAQSWADNHFGTGKVVVE